VKPLDELTTRCIHCGLCLEACPTFVVTGNEVESPRGRIYLVRQADEGKLDWTEDVKPHLDLCLGCRACETACPSGVQYGEILELARDEIERLKPQRAKSLLLDSTTSPTILKIQLLLGGLLPGRRVPTVISKLLSGEPAEADQPRIQINRLPTLDEASLPPIRGEVYMLEGCAMRVLYPRVHAATRRLLRRIGYSVREATQGCCGALHAHNGYLGEAKKLGASLVAAFPDDLPILVDSAGCGSTMKEYGELIGTDSAANFATRVKDASEFLLANGLLEALEVSPGLDVRATYHDACHLAHGQRVASDPRRLIQAIPGIEYVSLPEADMCCGSAGIYNVTQPKMARTLVERKIGNIEATKAKVVATGNPGCHAWIAQAAREHGGKVTVLHTMELLEAAFIGLASFEE
jgi:glycolate oxidase iron-sulfur subunit